VLVFGEFSLGLLFFEFAFRCRVPSSRPSLVSHRPLISVTSVLTFCAGLECALPSRHASTLRTATSGSIPSRGRSPSRAATMAA